MEYQKLKNLLGTTFENVPRFSTTKLIKVHNQFEGSYDINRQITFKTEMLQSDSYE